MNLLIESIIDQIQTEFKDIEIHNAWGETSFFYNPASRLKRGVYFATLKDKDGENDKASNLNRPDVFRLNFGLPSSIYIEMFGPKPKRPTKGNIVDGPWDFAMLNKLMPHPVYGWIGWVCVLTPTEETFKQCIPLIREAYKKAQITFENRVKKESI